LLDEPLSNLDAKLRLEMRSEIRRVCKESGLTAIYVTHDQKEALSIADRMAILESGKIAQIGRPEDVYRRPQSRIIADFIGETNFIPGTIASLKEDTAIVDTAIGRFEGIVSDAAWKPRPNEPVVLSIRPESWTIHANARSTNSTPGRIGESVYLGEVAQYEFLAGPLKMKIFEMNPQLSHRLTDANLRERDAARRRHLAGLIRMAFAIFAALALIIAALPALAGGQYTGRCGRYTRHHHAAQ
jgi:iron(III) transport system ATP-binding protein